MGSFCDFLGEMIFPSTFLKKQTLYIQSADSNIHRKLPNAVIPKLCTCTFLMYFQVLKLYYWKQIWKFMCRYFDKFSAKFLAKPIKFCSLRSRSMRLWSAVTLCLPAFEMIWLGYGSLLVVSYCDKDFITFKEVAWKFWNSDFFWYFGLFFKLKLYYY